MPAVRTSVAPRGYTLIQPVDIVWEARTISAVSVPPIENSRSAYFFQYPKKSGNLARKQSKTLRTSSIADGEELRVTPPSSSAARTTSASHFSKSSSFSICKKGISSWTRAHGHYGRSYHSVKKLLDLDSCLVAGVLHLRDATTAGNQHGGRGMRRLGGGWASCGRQVCR